MSTPAAPPPSTRIAEEHPTATLRAEAERLGISEGMAKMLELLEVLDAGACAARPRPSCSRPDGQTLRHWVSKPWWTNEGEACS